MGGCGGGSGSTPSGAGGAGGTGDAGGAGSGGGDETNTVTSCDVNGAGGHTCYEYGIGYTGSRAAGCNVLHGTYVAGPCDGASSSGGCKQPVPPSGTQTTYYYPPTTPADVMVQCTNDGNATYVAP